MPNAEATFAPAQPSMGDTNYIRIALWTAHLIENQRERNAADQWVDVDVDQLVCLGVTWREVAARVRALCVKSPTRLPTLKWMAEHYVAQAFCLRELGSILSSYLSDDEGRSGFPWKAIREHPAFKIKVARNVTLENTKQFKFPWRERQALRLQLGIYRQVPWINELTPITDHFAHVSTTDAKMVAYTPDAKKGERDIVVQTKPGRYLAKFYANELSKDQIHLIQARLGDAEQLRFAKTPAEIVDIYVRHGVACMRAPARSWPLKQQPCQVYGNSDLQLAYMVDITGRPNARVLVWPDKKRYGRMYGDTYRLEARLKELGYKQSRLDGARIRRILIKDHPNHYVMPYLDGTTKEDFCGTYDIVRNDDGSISQEWFKIGGPFQGGSSSNGYVDHYDPVPCARCAAPATRREQRRVVVDNNGTSAQWCLGCVRGYGFESMMSGNWISRDLRVPYNDCPDRSEEQASAGYCTEAERRERCFHCIGTDQWWNRNYYTPVTLADGRVWVQWYFRRNGFVGSDRKYYANGQTPPQGTLPLEPPAPRIPEPQMQPLYPTGNDFAPRGSLGGYITTNGGNVTWSEATTTTQWLNQSFPATDPAREVNVQQVQAARSYLEQVAHEEAARRRQQSMMATRERLARARRAQDDDIVF